ncbi:MAG: hypothetical protein SFW36_05510 [Leptolyngbyaceae cyanobacterium bins.59]|nr:hypothetical protein [Leptolyngbyaceae cyanobacterium bins.59]
MDRKDQTILILLEEYKALKAEQSKRIGFRDNLLYVTLGLFGAITSFAITSPKGHYAFLVIPWISLVMGWTYVVNDEKISAIGYYIRHDLDDRIRILMVGTGDNHYLFGWETAHRDDPHRKRRKYLQLLIDEITFVFSGLIALLIFWLLVPQVSIPLIILSLLEALLLIGLGFQIKLYTDLERGR